MKSEMKLKKLVTIMAVAFLLISSTGASAVTKVTITPQNKVSKKNPVITVKLSGMPTTHGL